MSKDKSKETKMEKVVLKTSSVSRKPDLTEETARLKKSMRYCPIRKDQEKAKEFLSRLSMYDQDGKLIKR